MVTDHIALSWLNNTSPQNGRLARWAMYLQEYNFDIVYRQGHLHSNFDALSRPVLAATVVSGEQTLNDDDTIIEAYDDSHLMHYLKFKKLLPGASNRQIKRVMKLSDKYKLDLSQNILFYRKSNKHDYMKVPPINERPEIIEKAHLLGHFNAQSTLSRIKLQYF